MGARSTKRWLPLWVDMGDASCVIVGGGKVAWRKIDILMESGCKIRVVAREAIGEIRKLAEEGKLELSLREPSEEDLQGARLVILATDDEAFNREVSSWAKAKGVLCNVVDSPELCTAIFPAIFRDGRITVAVSTEGASPSLAARLRDEIAEKVARSWALAAEIIGQVRVRLKKEEGNSSKRIENLRALAQDDFLDCCERGDPEEIFRMVLGKTGVKLDLDQLRKTLAEFQKVK